MPEIQYIGEYLLPRQLGHFAIVLSFVSAILATLAYFFATQNQNRGLVAAENILDSAGNTEGVAWRRIGRWAFGVHGLAIVSVIISIFYVMITKRYEYFYAHSHTDDQLEFRYVFAAFWEGQEGSFLLWMFWHVVLGAWIILRGSSKKAANERGIWESPVLAVLACVQVFLSSMILGLHFGVGENIIKWGSNPMLLLRETNDIPVFKQADYLEKIQGTAKGLNQLLQNWWMTIHPPTLFLGFASTTIPFCFAIAGLWLKKYTEWLRPAMPYALFSGAILGTGIMMGGMWAYEALSFNGFWAWDPVENMSLIPWLTLIAGIHTHLIANATGQSIRATIVFYILTFLLILYSTFLTRSGILGDTSVHAFTEIGLEWQLVFFQLFFVGVGAYFLIKNYKKIPAPQKEEAVSSREFWMFIGSLVLLLSVVLIGFTTSIPVFNKIAGYCASVFKFEAPHWTSPVDVVAHYNNSQLWVGVFMGFLSATTQFLRFKEFNFKNYRKTFAIHAGVALAITGLITALSLNWVEANAWQYVLLLFASVFTVVANIQYAGIFLKKNPKAAGSAVAHVGFGLLIVGTMASGLNKKWISSNRFAMEGLVDFTEEQYGKYVLLPKNGTLMMNGYEVRYSRDTAYADKRFFTLDFKRKDPTLTKTLDSFSVNPYIQISKQTGKIAASNPAKKHYLTYDVFTNIASLPPSEQDPDSARAQEMRLKYEPFLLPQGVETTAKRTVSFVKKSGDTVKTTLDYTVAVDGLDLNPRHPKYVSEEKDVAVGVNLTFRKGADSVYTAKPIILLRDEAIYQLPVTINELGVRVKVEDEIFNVLFDPTKSLKFEEKIFKQGSVVNFKNKKITLVGVNPKPTPKGFTLQAEDLAIGLQLKVETADGKTYSTEPVYVIRGSSPIPVRDEVADLGLNFLIEKVNPAEQNFTIKIAEKDPLSMKVPISIAEGAERTDYIILEATVNPGINLVWAGSIMMMMGLGMAMFYRVSKK